MGISAQGAEHLTMKIGRAYKHAKEFDALVVAHCTRKDLFTATGREENGRYIVRVEYAPQDGDITLSLADFAYNLRSGLDQLAWQLCLAGGGTPGRGTMFPIFEKDDPPTQANFLKCVSGMPPDAIDVIRDLQPYKRADFRQDPLWQLNALANLDKHRLPAGRSSDTSFYIEPVGFIKTDFDNGIELSWPLCAKDRVKVEGKTPGLTFGEPIDSSTPSAMPLELTRQDIAEIYRYVREDVGPRLIPFLT
jgi:hypothetical protein